MDYHKMSSPTLVIITACITWAPMTAGLIGYDCGGEGLNITSLSLTNIGECHMDNIEPKTQETYLQLLQLNEYDHTHAFSCKIEIDRQIYHCGMHSHISAVNNGKAAYIREISESNCRKLHDTGTIFLGNNALLDGIKPNSTTSRSITFAGSIGADGSCKGTTYGDPLGTWDDVIVQAAIKISIRDFEIPVKFSTNEVILPSGVRCKSSARECNDADGSTVHWARISTNVCKFDQYAVLYEGMAHKLTPPPEQEEGLTIYTVTNKEATFALTRTSESNLCGYKLIHTEHPKLYLLETQPGRTGKGKARIATDNLDLLTYVNSKFVYVERHFRTQLTAMYKDIMTQKCAIERQVLENALSLSSIAPDEMAFRLMKTPGYTAVTAGEVIYIIKCIPVMCKVRPTDTCYNELPVTL